MGERGLTAGARCARFIVASVAVLSALAALAGPPVTRDPDVRVDRSAGLQRSPAKKPTIIVRGNRVYATYVDRRYFTSYEPYFATSVNQGGTWNTNDRRLNRQSPGSPDGDTAASYVANSGDPNVYVLFVSNDGPQSVPTVISSNDRGATWPRVSQDLAVLDISASRGDFGIVAGQNGVAYAYWFDNRANIDRDQSVWMRKTADGGATWAAFAQVNIPDVVPAPAPPDQRERSTQPSACVVGNAALRVAWRDKRDTDPRTFLSKPGRIVFRGSDANGAFTTAANPEIRLDRNGPTSDFESQKPFLNCAGTTLAVAWEEDTNADATLENWDVFASISTNDGVTWSTNPVRIDDGPGSTFARNPRVAIGGGSPAVIYVAWEDNRAGGVDLYFARSTDSGATFSTPRRVNLGTNAGASPPDTWDISAEGPNVTIAWSDNRNGSVSAPRRDIFALRSTDFGANFPAIPDRIDLGTGPGVADSIEVVVSENASGYVAIYSDCRNSTIGNCRQTPVPPENELPQADFFSGGFAASYDPSDADSDAIKVALDNCPDFPNPDQADLDSDAVGDYCDNFGDDPNNDRDVDGFASYIDNCPYNANADQDDTDADTWGDRCDWCPGVNDAINRDLDLDKVGDNCDPDVDGDGILDTADGDDDNDGVADNIDNCRTVANARQKDKNANGVGDACDTGDLLVSNVQVRPDAPRATRVTWDKEPGAVSYNVYVGPVSRLSLPALKGATPPMYCYGPALKFYAGALGLNPPPGEAYYYKITAKNASTEGSAGLLPDSTEWPKVACSVALAADWDNDTVQNLQDNCRFDANATQANLDHDSEGDVCDPFPGDPTNDALDGDGAGANVDNCPFIPNPGQADADGDGLGDVCDACPSVADAVPSDTDKDGIPDACDPDSDGDGLANVDDDDDDGDGIADAGDNCALTGNGLQSDRDADGIGDACDVADGEVNGLTIRRANLQRLEWVREQGAVTYSIFTGLTTGLAPGVPYGSCLVSGTTLPWADAVGPVSPDTARWYLVRAQFAGGPGTLGRDSAGSERQAPAGCP